MVRRGQVVRVNVRLEDPVDAQARALHVIAERLRGFCARASAHEIVVEHGIDDGGVRAPGIGDDVGIRSRGRMEEGLDSWSHGADDSRGGSQTRRIRAPPARRADPYAVCLLLALRALFAPDLCELFRAPRG